MSLTREAWRHATATTANETIAAVSSAAESRWSASSQSAKPTRETVVSTRIACAEMADWVTISSLATAGGTLVLAVATFASVRSANRAARVAEHALQVGLRPVLTPSRPEDPPEKVNFGDDRWFHVPAGGALLE